MKKVTLEWQRGVGKEGCRTNIRKPWPIWIRWSIYHRKEWIYIYEGGRFYGNMYTTGIASGRKGMPDGSHEHWTVPIGYGMYKGL